jgi:hypothetical protein
MFARAARIAVALCALCAACGGDARGSPTPDRRGRFGSLRDLVLFEPPGHGVFFLDRFEATRADWNDFADSVAGAASGAARYEGAGDLALPASGFDLRQARAFARWRFGRVPRLDEWEFAVTAGGRHPFPWGNRVDATRANTGELGLHEPLPVGTFESGRRADGDWPYDLIGNVSEWTETVPHAWFASDADPVASPAVGRARCLASPALAVWQLPGGLLPSICAAAAGGENVPREVVGGDFLAPMTQSVEAVRAGDRRQRTGVRVCATPAQLLDGLLADAASPSDVDAEQIRRFVRRGHHRPALQREWPAALQRAGAGAADRPIARILARGLGGG